MRIGIVSGILHGKHGGPASVIRAHAQAMAGHADVQVFAVAETAERKDILDELPQARLFPAAFPRLWFRGRGLAHALAQAAQNLDVLHAHMLWDHPVFAAARASARNAKPLVITPHGALLFRERMNGAHKQIYRKLLLPSLLRRTACIHALTHSEEMACRNAGIRIPIRVIPNGVPASEFGRRASTDLAHTRWPPLRDRRVLLYLGRIWSGKGLDILASAWSRIHRKAEANGWILVMAGPDYRSFSKCIYDRITREGMERTVMLAGPVAGEQKASLMSAAEAFVLPSHGEAFSMALLEAMAARLPCVYTDKCGMPELALAGGGWSCRDDAGELTAVLDQLMAQPPSVLREMGEKAERFARARYTLEQVGQQLLAMYREFA